MRMVVSPRPVLSEVREDLLLRLGVDGGDGIVQDEDLGVLHEGARDGDALLLPARDGDAALAEHGHVFILEIDDVVVHGGKAGSFFRRLRFRRLFPLVGKAMLFSMVSLNKKLSCGTYAAAARTSRMGMVLTSCPSKKTVPSGTL